MNKFCLVIFLIACASCNNSNSKDPNGAEVSEPLEANQNPVSVSDPASHESPTGFDHQADVSKTLVHAQDDKFIVKIDRMNNDDIRYISWNKPKKENENPDLMLRNPAIERLGTGGGYIYSFKNGEWSYILEDKWMGESDDKMGKFLRVQKQGKDVLYSRLENK